MPDLNWASGKKTKNQVHKDIKKLKIKNQEISAAWLRHQDRDGVEGQFYMYLPARHRSSNF